MPGEVILHTTINTEHPMILIRAIVGFIVPRMVVTVHRRAIKTLLTSARETVQFLFGFLAAMGADTPMVRSVKSPATPSMLYAMKRHTRLAAIGANIFIAIPPMERFDGSCATVPAQEPVTFIVVLVVLPVPVVLPHLNKTGRAADAAAAG